MNPGKISRILLYIFLTLLFLLIVLAILAQIVNKPPVEEVNLARKTLAEARQKLAGHYAEDILKEAEKNYHQSVEEWKIQNNKLFIFRDYTNTTELASESYQQALTAMRQTEKTAAKLKDNAEQKLTSLKQQINYFEKYYKGLALKPSIMQIFNNGKMRFLEAQIEYKNKDYKRTMALAMQAEEHVSQARKLAHFKLNEFYKDYPVWEKNIKLAYNLSQKGQTVLLIDKMDASLTVLKGGKEHKTYLVEFGDNWMGDKSMTGDKATPEGIYKVQEKKYGSKTRYYKALLIDYPNKDDKRRYQALVRSGKIPANRGIGGLIEIHGGGGKGVHWTDGCIALDNKEMDQVYLASSVNTPVIIVGSQKPMEEYLQQ